MKTLEAVVFIVVGMTAILAAIAAIAKVRARVLAQGRADLQQFVRVSKRLIDDRTVPEAVVEFVHRLSSEAGRPGLARWMTLEILSGRFAERPSNPRDGGLMQDVDKLNADQKQALAQCLAFGLMSSAAANQLLAIYLRRVIFFGLFESDTKRIGDAEKTRVIVMEYSRSRSNKDKGKLLPIRL